MAALALRVALLVLAAPAALNAQVGGTLDGAKAAEPSPATVAPPATVAAIALSIRSRAIQDSRCYLMNGGAVESFFISEDTPVGSIIGTLSVNGDPREEGDITLRLQERGAAVGIAPGSKNMTLLRALDREEKLGPSNVYVNVRCDRRRTTDPSFVIPVSVRVWDVNDNAPQWSSGGYSARVSELAAVGTRLAPQLRASDADQPGPHATIHYTVLPGPHSEYVGFVNELDSALVIKKPLDFETLRNFTVTLRAQDQGSPPRHNDTALAVTVLDADDHNPRFSHEHYAALLPADAVEGTILETSPGPVSAADQDLGINAPLYYSTSGDNQHLVVINRDTGVLAATRQLLRAQLPVTIVIKATQVDNADRYALATVGISRVLAAVVASTDSTASTAESADPASTASSAEVGGVRFSARAYSAAVSEATPPGAALLQLHTQPPANAPRQNPLQFYVSDRSFLEKFAINSGGEVILRRALDYETANNYYYQVMVTDSVTNDTASINITVLDENEWEPRFRYPQYSFRAGGGGGGGGAGGGGGLVALGRLDAHDGDAADTVTLALHGPAASMFYLNDDGELFLREEVLPTLNTSVIHVIATAYDSGSPPKQTSVPVLVQVEAARGVSALTAGAAAALALLALLALLAAALCLYVKRTKPASVSHTKPPAPLDKCVAPPRASPARAAAPAPPAAPPAPAPAAAAPSGSLLSVSAGASTILANSTTSLDRAGTAQQDDRSSEPRRGSGACAEGALMSDHLQAGAGRSGVAWPSRTIPARIKKLSWDDQGSGGENPVHDATNPAVAEHMNLTVYF